MKLRLSVLTAVLAAALVSSHAMYAFLVLLSSNLFFSLFSDHSSFDGQLALM